MIPCAEPYDAMLLLCIVRHVELTGVGPSWDEMCRATGVGRNATWHRLQDLRRAGLVSRSEGKRGVIRPLVTEVPLKTPQEVR